MAMAALFTGCFFTILAHTVALEECIDETLDATLFLQADKPEHVPARTLFASHTRASRLCSGSDCDPMLSSSYSTSGSSYDSSYGSSSSCTPRCTWQCETPKCDQVCSPTCQAPVCETRCDHVDTSKCQMECSKPACSIMCPSRQCSSKDCPACKTRCDKPQCQLQCPGTQACETVCEQPRCDWSCKAPEDCPTPKCSMVCEEPKHCGGHTYEKLPPLRPGQTSVQTFVAPLSLLQGANGNMMSVLASRALIENNVTQASTSAHAQLVQETILLPLARPQDEELVP